MSLNITEKSYVKNITNQIAETMLKIQSDSENIDLQQKLKSLKKKISIIKDEIRNNCKTLKANGQTNEAINVLDEACNLFPDDMNLHKSLVSLLIDGLKKNPKNKDLKAQIKILLTLLENRLPNDLDINTKWIAYYKIYNSYNEMEKHLRIVLEKHPYDFIACSHLASVLEKNVSSPLHSDNLIEAASLLREIIKKMSLKNTTSVQEITILKNRLAGVLIKIGDKKKSNLELNPSDPSLNEAYSILLEVYHLDQKNIFTLSHLASVYRLLNDLSAEKFYLKAMLEIDHKNLSTQVRLHKVLQLLKNDDNEKEYEPPLPLDFFEVDMTPPKSFFDTLYNRLLEALNNEEELDKEILMETLSLMLSDDSLTEALKKKIEKMLKIASSNKPKEMITLKSLARGLTGSY